MTKGKDARILIIDGVTVARDLLKGALKQLGFKKITEAENGKRALQILREDDPFDLAIIEVKLPDMTGLDLLKEIKTDNTLANTPVMILTAEAKKEYVVKALKTGAADYMLKPYTLESMRKKLDTILK